MATLAFNNTKGSAIKNAPDSYKYADGENIVRLVGGILARYIYWVKGTNDKDIPIECLSFDRELEKFTNKETDHVPKFFPDKKCAWSYAMNCIDVKGDGKVKVLNLKKKLFEQIITAAEDLGDPTDPDTGWDVVFEKKKTGPLAYNVEYTLKVLRCKPRSLSEDERAAIEASTAIDVLVPRSKPADIEALLTKLTTGTADEGDGGNVDNSTKEAIKDL